MPETTIYKHGDALPREHNVDAAWHLDADTKVLSETQTLSVKG
jgi:hypothetical protein